MNKLNFKNIMPAILVLLAILNFGPVAYSQTWSEIKPEYNYWKASALSSDGGIILAAHGSGSGNNGGLLKRSNNGGSTWVNTGPTPGVNKNWQDIVMSANGQYMMAAENNGRIYRSADGGTSWNETQPAGNNIGNWRIAMSDNGNTLLAANNGGRLYKSSDYGETWTELQPEANNNNLAWCIVAVSGDGSTFLAGIYSTYNVFVSHNAGGSWTTSPSYANQTLWQSADFSYDGQIAYMATLNNTNPLKSTDGLLTWNTMNAGNKATNLAGISCSSDGQTLATISMSENFIYYSTNSGLSWSNYSIPPYSSAIFRGTSIAVSQDGSTILGLTQDNVMDFHTFSSIPYGRIYKGVLPLPAPTITSFTPASAEAGTNVTITGTNFTGATAVSFGGTAAASFTVVSSTSITAVVASGTTGSISVTTPASTATSGDIFTLCAPPSITSQSSAMQTQCVNGTFNTISVSAIGDGLSYQWYSATNASNSAGNSLSSANGAQTNTYTPQAAAAGTLYYYCVVTGTCGTATNAVSGSFITNALPAVTLSALPTTICTGIPAKFNGSSICGTNGAVNFSASSSAVRTLLTNVIDNITMETWVKWSGTGNASDYQIIVYNGNTGNGGYGIVSDAKGNLSILIGGKSFLSPGLSLTAGIWQYIAIVRNAGTWSMYLNGMQYPVAYNTTSPGNPNTASDSKTSVGANQSKLLVFYGDIDEVKFWTVVRSTAQIQADMKACSTAATAGLLAYWSLNNGSGSIATDGSGNSNDLTLTNTSWINAGAPTGGTYSLNFGDGNSSSLGADVHTYSTSGTYNTIFYATDINGCMGSTSSTITVNQSPTASISGTQTGCGTVLLAAAGGSTYSWSGGNSTGSASNTFSSSGTYTVTATDGIGCWSKATKSVTVNSLPVASISGAVPASADFATVDGAAGLVFDASGNLYVADQMNREISKITSGGTVSTFATGFFYPSAITIDASGNLFVADQDLRTISKITPGGTVSTFATGFTSPTAITIDASGILFLADRNTIKMITSGGTVSTFASGLSSPQGLAFDASGNLYAANYGNSTISKITSGGTVSTFASGLSSPQGLAFDASGILYVANQNGTISKVSSNGTVSAFVSGLSNPSGLAFDATGHLYTITGYRIISKLTFPAVNITTVCSGGSVTLIATPGTGEVIDWYATATGGSALLSGSNNYVTGALSLTTTYYAESRNTTTGCVAATRTPITASINALPTVGIIVSPSETVCIGTSLTLTGTGATSYSWSGDVTDGSAFTPALTATYTVTGTDANGCTNTATQKVTILPLPTITSFTPASAETGATVIITGTNFTHALAVSFSGRAAASYIVTSSTEIAAVVGTGSSGSVSATTPCGTASLAGFTYISNLNWTGTTSTDWNTSSNWSTNAVPVITDNVTIPNVANNPIVNQAPGTPAVCNNFTINAGAVVTVAPGKALTVNGTLENNAGNAGLVISNGASLIESTPLVAATVTTAFTGAKWHFISSPVSGATALLYSGKYLQTMNENKQAYTDISSIDVQLTPVKGFAVWSPAGGFSADYTGNLNTGDLSFSTTAGSYSGPNGGFNLVGNPYPCSLDWSLCGKNNLNNAIYVENNGQWTTYIDNIGLLGGTKYIAPGEGFLVQATAGGSLTVSNAAKAHNTTAFFKYQQTVPNLLRLELAGNGYRDEAAVRFTSDATEGFDGNFDAMKLFGDDPQIPNIYTVAGADLAVNTLPETTLVPLAVKIGQPGNYTITAIEINELQYVTLEDTKTGIFTELAKQPYSFNFEAGENEVRFMLHFNTMLGIADKKDGSAIIYSYRKTAYINLISQAKSDIFIYNMAGQLVASKLSVKDMNEISVENTGNYIVKVVTDKTSVVKKIFIQ